jgi:hypothetical protein
LIWVCLKMGHVSKWLLYSNPQKYSGAEQYNLPQKVLHRMLKEWYILSGITRIRNMMIIQWIHLLSKILLVSAREIQSSPSNLRWENHHRIWGIHFLGKIWTRNHGFYHQIYKVFLYFCSLKPIQWRLVHWIGLPSGKRLHNYGISPLLIGKSTISMAMFNSYVWHNQRVYEGDLPISSRHFCCLQWLNPPVGIDERSALTA